jgi:hypothetical protein
VRKQIGVPVLTDVHEDTPLARWPRWSMCCRRRRFCAARPISSSPSSSQGKPVNIKKGQFLSPWEMQNVVDKARSTGNTPDHGVRARLLLRLQQSGVRHALPGGDARHRLSGGVRRHALGAIAGRQGRPPPAASASSCRCWRARRSPPASPGFSWKPIPNPAKALSDGPNAWPLDRMASLLATLVELDIAVKKNPSRNHCYEPYRRYRGREIIDSRGNPTVEADVVLQSGVVGRAAVPSGASTGSREAVELRDGDAEALSGQGRAQGGRAHQRQDLRDSVLGLDAQDQAGLDAR